LAKQSQFPRGQQGAGAVKGIGAGGGTGCTNKPNLPKYRVSGIRDQQAAPGPWNAGSALLYKQTQFAPHRLENGMSGWARSAALPATTVRNKPNSAQAARTTSALWEKSYDELVLSRAW